MALVDFIHKRRRQPRILDGSGNGFIIGRSSGRYSICPKSRVEIGEDCKGRFFNFKLVNSRVYIGDGCRLGPLHIHAVDSEIHIGNGVRISGKIGLVSPEQSRISIGDECLIAGGTRLDTSDHHSIIDQTTGERINPARPIKIGSRVWLGRDVMILKGSTIGNNSIIGARSLVSGSIPQNVMAAGVPARVIREGVKWDFNLL